MYLFWVSFSPGMKLESGLSAPTLLPCPRKWSRSHMAGIPEEHAKEAALSHPPAPYEFTPLSSPYPEESEDVRGVPRGGAGRPRASTPEGLLASALGWDVVLTDLGVAPSPLSSRFRPPAAFGFTADLRNRTSGFPSGVHVVAIRVEAACSDPRRLLVFGTLRSRR